MKAVLMVLALALTPVFISGAALAKGKEGHKMMMMAEPSKEDRAKMVTMHEEMAACLKSDKKYSECQDTMMKQCPLMKKGMCPMMHDDHGMMKDEGAKGADEHAHH